MRSPLISSETIFSDKWVVEQMGCRTFKHKHCYKDRCPNVVGQVMRRTCGVSPIDRHFYYIPSFSSSTPGKQTFGSSGVFSHLYFHCYLYLSAKQEQLDLIYNCTLVKAGIPLFVIWVKFFRWYIFYTNHTQIFTITHDVMTFPHHFQNIKTKFVHSPQISIWKGVNAEMPPWKNTLNYKTKSLHCKAITVTDYQYIRALLELTSNL